MSPLACLPPVVVDALPTLSPSAVRVAVAVASFMGKSGECWPGYNAIGERAGIGRRDTIRIALAELRERGLLKVKCRRRTTALLSWQDPAQSVPSDAQGSTLNVDAKAQGCALSVVQGSPLNVHPEAQDCTLNVDAKAQGCALSVAQDSAVSVVQKKGTTEGVRTTTTSRSSSEQGLPPELEDLELYAADDRLCGRWAQLLRTWRRTYPWLDVLEEVRSAHAWEVENVRKRKTDRARFLGRWLRRSEQRRQRDAPVVDEPPPMTVEEIDALEAGVAEWEARHAR